MENASKALLIAGAILVVILIIAVGMMVYNSAKGTVDEGVAQMGSQELQMYNNQYTTYAGNNVNGSNVKALLEKIQLNNVNNTANAAKTIKISFRNSTSDAATTDVSDAINAVVTAKYYTVVITDTTPGHDGLMDTVTITGK
jgi:flagellar basal body-associated protein FliL